MFSMPNLRDLADQALAAANAWGAPSQPAPSVQQNRSKTTMSSPSFATAGAAVTGHGGIFHRFGLRVVSETLGHASIRITKDPNSHPSGAQRKHAADAMDAALWASCR
jgi:hypothetical protein